MSSPEPFPEEESNYEVERRLRKDVWDFLKALAKHTNLVLTSVLGFVLFAIAQIAGYNLPPWTVAPIVGICLVIGAFLVWRDERNLRLELSAKQKESSPDKLPRIDAKIEPHFFITEGMDRNRAYGKFKSFGAKITNLGRETFFIEEMGFTVGMEKYRWISSPHFPPDKQGVDKGRNQVHLFWKPENEELDLEMIDGVYLKLEDGKEFVNKQVDTTSLQNYFQNEFGVMIEGTKKG